MGKWILLAFWSAVSVIINGVIFEFFEQSDHFLALPEELFEWILFISQASLFFEMTRWLEPLYAKIGRLSAWLANCLIAFLFWPFSYMVLVYIFGFAEYEDPSHIIASYFIKFLIPSYFVGAYFMGVSSATAAYVLHKTINKKA